MAKTNSTANVAPTMEKEEPKQELAWYQDKEGRIVSGYDSTTGKFDPYQFDPGMPYAPKGALYRLASNPTQDLEDPFDLDNLRFIDKQKVIHAKDEIERIATENTKELVCMIATGGTIAMHTDNEGKLCQEFRQTTSCNLREVTLRIALASYRFHSPHLSTRRKWRSTTLPI